MSLQKVRIGRGASVGDFTLEERVGRGAFGQVWRAHWQGGPLEAAVKLFEPEGGAQLVLREVEATARLRHPGIARILDYGTVAPSDDGPPLPWVATGFVAGQTLRQRPPKDWPELRGALESMLASLAFAHARGVVHRDLKPANVIWSGEPGSNAGVTLIDFGIAAIQQGHEGARGGIGAGTPGFMAPEQFDPARRHEQGPWTDLYALGCTAWFLCTGRLPFEASDPREMLHQHLYAPLPSMSPRFSVPASFEGWLRGLLNRSSWSRPARAADVAWSLMHLGEASRGGALSATASVSEARSTWGGLLASTWAETPPSLLALTHPVSQRPTPAVSALPMTAPPMPARWDVAGLRAARARRGLLEAGERLFGLREPPLVGRIEARDRLWDALGAVASEGRPRAVAVCGVSGCGKSRLVRWLVELAHELGAATALIARHDAEGKPGIPGAIRSFFGVENAGAESVTRTLSDWSKHTHDDALGPHLSALALETSGGLAVSVIISRLIRALVAQRPVVLWLDDAHASSEARDLALWLLDEARAHQVTLPLLVVLTLQTDAPGVEDGGFGVFEGRDDVSRLDLGPLGPNDQLTLVETLLGLSGPVATKLVAASGGNPLFATEVVRGWIQGGELAFRDGFFRPCDEGGLSIPESPLGAWEGRIEHLLATIPEETRREAVQVLEIAACLGDEVASEVWRSAASEAGLEVDPGLVGQLVRHGIVERTPAGIRFVHGMLRRSVMASCRRGGRWSHVNSACASAIERSMGTSSPTPKAQARLGRLLLEADRPEDAARSLEEAAEALALLSDPALVDVLGELTRAMDAGEGEQPARATVLLLRSNHLRHAGRLDEAAGLAREALALTRQRGWLEHQCRGHLALADAFFWMSRLDEAKAEAVAALEVCDKGNARLSAQCAHMLSSIDRWRLDLSSARAHAQRAKALYEGLGDSRAAADMRVNLAMLMRIDGDPAGEGELRAAREVIEAVEDVHQLGIIDATLGQFLQMASREEEALDAIQSAVANLEMSVDRINLGICLGILAEQLSSVDRLEEAVRAYGRSLGLLEIVGEHGSAANFGIGLAWCQARQGRLELAAEAMKAHTETLRAHNLPAYLANALNHLIRVERCLGLPRHAIEAHIDELESIGKDKDRPALLLKGVAQRGHLALREGDGAEAVRHFERADAINRGLPTDRKDLSGALARLERAMGCAPGKLLGGEHADDLPEGVRRWLVTRS